MSSYGKKNQLSKINVPIYMLKYNNVMYVFFRMELVNEK